MDLFGSVLRELRSALPIPGSNHGNSSGSHPHLNPPGTCDGGIATGDQCGGHSSAKSSVITKSDELITTVTSEPITTRPPTVNLPLPTISDFHPNEPQPPVNPTPAPTLATPLAMSSESQVISTSLTQNSQSIPTPHPPSISSTISNTQSSTVAPPSSMIESLRTPTITSHVTATTSSNSANNPTQALKQNRMNVGPIVGAVVAVLVLAGLVAAFLVYMRRRARQERDGWKRASYEPSRRETPELDWEDNNYQNDADPERTKVVEHHLSGQTFTDTASGLEYVEPNYGYPEEKIGYAS